MKYNELTNKDNWTDQEWPGNPSLGLKASCKLFSNPLPGGRTTPVWVFGGYGDFHGFHFTVSAGANSDFSYTGLATYTNDIEKAKREVDILYTKKRLFK